MTVQAHKSITFGHSPDADDAFMFYGLASGNVQIPNIEIKHEMRDIQSLNHLASIGKLEVTAISAAHYPAVSHLYRIMSCGSSVGRQYGPVIVSSLPIKESELEGAVIAVPGRHTTSWMLYRLFAPKFGSALFLNFDDVEDAVRQGDADAGILLHEGQILYQERGLHLVLELGQRWFDSTNLPIPLGLDLVSRRLDVDTAQAAVNALAASIRYARQQEDEALDYALEFGRGVKKEDARRFVRMYVNDDTQDLGEEGIEALQTLYSMAKDASILNFVPTIDIIQSDTV